MRTLYLLAVYFAVVVSGGAADAWGTTNLFPNVEARICEGKIVDNFPPLRLDAEWRIEWPEAISNVSQQVLGSIQRQMIDDCFSSVVNYNWRGKRVSQVYPTPDKALQLVFSRAYSKLDVPPDEDSFGMRSFDFGAKLSIRFADAGYIGYVLKGWENEGGNGCHSYVAASVLSLATGQPVKESDFMTPSGVAAFPKALFDRVSRKEEVRDYLFEGVNDATAALENFIIEPEGIRWWVPAYSIFAGAAGVQDMLMTWQELKPLMKPVAEEKFKAIFAKR